MKTSKAGKVIQILAISVLLVVGYLINATIMFVRVGASQEIYLLSFMLVYAVVYLSFWLITFIIACKRNSKKLINLYFIFWLFSLVCFVLLSLVESTFFGLFGFILFIPLAGVDSLRFYITNGYLYAQNMHIALVISIIMFLLGFVVKKAFLRQS